MEKKILKELKEEADKIQESINKALLSNELDHYAEAVALYNDWYQKGVFFLEQKDKKLSFMKIASNEFSTKISTEKKWVLKDTQYIYGRPKNGGDIYYTNKFGIEKLKVIQNEIKEKLQILIDISEENKLALWIDKKSGNFVLNTKTFETKIQPGTTRYIVLKTMMENGGENSILEWEYILAKVNVNLKKENKSPIKKDYLVTLISEYRKIGLTNIDGTNIISVRKGIGLHINNPMN